MGDSVSIVTTGDSVLIGGEGDGGLVDVLGGYELGGYVVGSYVGSQMLGAGLGLGTQDLEDLVLPFVDPEDPPDLPDFPLEQ